MIHVRSELSAFLHIQLAVVADLQVTLQLTFPQDSPYILNLNESIVMSAALLCTGPSHLWLSMYGVEGHPRIVTCHI